MKINDLITCLAAQDPTKRLPLGFAAPYPCHGAPADVAFEPRYNITVGDMLQSVRCAVEATFEVGRGESTQIIKIRPNTDCWLARPGHSGVYISEPLVEAMLGYPAEAQTQPEPEPQPQPKKKSRTLATPAMQKAA